MDSLEESMNELSRVQNEFLVEIRKLRDVVTQIKAATNENSRQPTFPMAEEILRALDQIEADSVSSALYNRDRLDQIKLSKRADNINENDWNPTTENRQTQPSISVDHSGETAQPTPIDDGLQDQERPNTQSGSQKSTEKPRDLPKIVFDSLDDSSSSGTEFDDAQRDVVSNNIRSIPNNEEKPAFTEAAAQWSETLI